MFLGQDPDSGYSPPVIELGLEGSFPFFKIFPDLIYSYEGSLDSSIYLRSDRDLTWPNFISLTVALTADHTILEAFYLTGPADMLLYGGL